MFNARQLFLYRSRTAGFTLVELIIVIVVLGIIAVVAMPRFADRADFQARGFQDETKSLLRYAQKSAIAQRRNVCVALGGAGVTLTIDTSTPTDGTCDAALTLPNPAHGGSGLTATISGVAAAGFNFQALGDTNQASNIIVTIPGVPVPAVTVDFRTGYVY